MLSPIEAKSGVRAVDPTSQSADAAPAVEFDFSAASPELVLLSLQNRAYAAQCSSARGEVERATAELERLRSSIRRAREAAERAREQSGFFGSIAGALGSDLAPILGAAGSAAAIVGSGGAATPLVLAAAGLGLGARTAQALELDPKLCAALGTAGAVAGLAAGDGAATASAWNSLAGALQAGAGAASAGSGVCGAMAGQYAARALAARADASSGRVDELEQRERVQGGFDALARCAADQRRAYAVASEIVEIEAERDRAVAELIGGAP